MTKPHKAGWIILLLAAFACKVVPSWESKGPFETSGCIRSIYLDPAHSKRLYAAAENGGLWVMADYANPNEGWKALTDQLENIQSRGVAKSLVDTGYITYGNGLGHVFHSFDNGKSWSRLTQMEFGYIRKLHVTTGMVRVPNGNYSRLVKETRVLVAARIGLYQIRLLNDEFSAIDTLFTGDVLDMMVSPTDPETVFIGARLTGLLRTTDRGVQWDTLFAWDPARDISSQMIKIAGSGNRIVVKFGNRIFRNNNNGIGSFDDISPVFDDNGGSDIGYRGNYSGRSDEWHHSLAISPRDPNLILAGQTDLAISRNGGANWEIVESSQRIGHEDIQSIIFTPDGTRIFLGNDGGVFEYRLDGGEARAMNKDLVTMQFYRVGVNGSHAVGNADHQGLHGTTDLNEPKPAWIRATPRNNGYGNNSLENDFVYADIKNPNRFFVVFQGRDLLRLNFPSASASDLLVFSDTVPLLRPFQARGNNNTLFNQLNYPANTFAIDPRSSSNTMLISAHTVLNTNFEVKISRNGNRNPTGGPANNCGDDNGNTFCYTTPVNNFSTWTRTLVTNAAPVVSIEFSKVVPGHVYLLGETGNVFFRREVNDDTQAWAVRGNIPLLTDDVARQIITDRFDSLKLYAISHRSFFRSADGGTTWTLVTSPTLPNVKFNAIETNPLKRSQVFLATDTSVFVSENAGDSWKVMGRYLPNAPVMQLTADRNNLYATSFGRGLWRVNLNTKKGSFPKGQ